jgi:hypothetical protein
MTPYFLAAIGVIQALGLFIVSGIDKRLSRLEDHLMGQWNGNERRTRHV